MKNAIASRAGQWGRCIKGVFNQFLDWLLSFGIRYKVMGIALGLVLLLGLATALQVRLEMQRTLTAELDKRGQSIARDLATRSVDLILTNDLFRLQELLRETVANNSDVRYAFIVDPGGQVLVHSFDRGLPQQLVEVNRVGRDENYHLALLETEEGHIRDFAVPIFGGQVGVVRVGLSEERVHQTVGRTTARLLVATAAVAFLGVLAALALTRVLTRPILELVDVTQAVAKGDLGQRAQVRAKDEIGQLSTAFNAMIRDLERAHQEIEASNRELLSRHRELAVLHAVALATSGPLNISEMLDRALKAVLKGLELSSGWVFLFDEEGQRTPLVCHAGMSATVVEAESSRRTGPCACKRVVESRQPEVIGPLEPSCPALGMDLGDGRRLTCHASVPLVSKGRVLGVLNVGSDDPERFAAEDMAMLGAIGRQIGVALENARLWEELKRKEEIRGQLLQKVITAQEEERKRIARELHDETSQALTSLIIGLNEAENAGRLEDVRARLAILRQTATQTLDAVHDLAVELRPSLLDDMGLPAALQRYTREYSAKIGIPVDFHAVDADGLRLPPEVETAVYRIVQEALTNVAKHADATQVSVLLEVTDANLIVIVEDDGQGFDAEAILASGARERKLGLFGMGERAELIGGTLTIESTPGMGTTVFVKVPLGEGR